MPEFVLNEPSRLYWTDFEQGYVEAMFFTNDTGDDSRPWHLNELGTDRLTLDSRAVIRRDCNAFLSHLMPDGRFARQWVDELASIEASYGEGIIDDRRAGQMFWYARQGHGVSWADDYDSCPIAEGLQNVCRQFGECYLETSRGWIYVQ